MSLWFDQRDDSGIRGKVGGRASNEPRHEAVFPVGSEKLLW